MPIFRHKKVQILFRHIPKTGGTSLERGLRDSGALMGLFSTELHGSRGPFPLSPQHFPDEYLKELFPADFFDFDFSVVRHPEERFLAEYRRAVRGRVARQAFVPNLSSWAESTIGRIEADPVFRDGHFLPQVCFVSSSTNIYRFEDGLNSAFNDASAVLRLQSEKLVPHLNSGAHIATATPAWVRKWIEDHYGEDFSSFGY